MWPTSKITYARPNIRNVRNNLMAIKNVKLNRKLYLYVPLTREIQRKYQDDIIKLISRLVF